MSIFLKLNLEAEPRRSSLLTQVQEGRDSILSLLFSEKRSRKKRTHTEPNTPKSDNTPTADLFDKSRKDQEKDKFLEIFEKQEKDHADGRAINRKIGKNAFFQDNKELFEEKLDAEGLIHLCRSLTLETFKESEIVYQKGDKTNDKIYLIYKGEVEVLQVGEDGGLKVECKQSNFSMMNLSVNDGNSQPKPRRSLFRQLNLESEMMYDRSTGRKSLDVKGLIAANPHLKSFVGKTMTSGEYLGKEVLEKRGEWEDTMVAKTETHLLVLNVKDLEHVKCRYEKEMIQRLNLIWKHLSVPTQNEGEIKNKFFECVNEKVLPFGENLLCEGDIDKHFYFLIDGKCEIQKKLKEKADSHHENSSPKTKAHKNIPICLVESGTFLGEELLFNKNACHEYTVKVTSAKAVLFQFSVADFKSTFNKEILDNIRESYQEKTKSHQDIYHNICKELNKRNSKTLTTLSLVSKSPTHQGSSNLGFGSRWDVMSGANSQEAENEASSTTKRNDGSTSRRFFTHVVATATDRTPLGLAGDRRNSDITKIKGQIMSFHHNVVVVKSDRIATEEVSPKGKYWNDNGHRFAEYEQYAYANAKDYDSLDQVVHTVGNKGRPGMDEYLNSIEDFENFSKELHRNKRDSKMMHPIESFKLNFKNPDEEKKANNTRNSRLSFIESPLFHKDSKEKDIIILNPGKMVSQEFQARSPVRKVSKSVKPSNSKIDLKALRNQFYDSPQVSIRDYLALYKKAHIHNKFARNNTENLKIKSGDYASLMKSKHLPSIHREDYSPKMDNLAEMKTIRVSMSKSPRVGKVTPLTRRPEHVVLEPINQKTPQVKTSLVKIRMTDRDL